ncbi:MAG: energy transducer TonB [bacterium]
MQLDYKKKDADLKSYYSLNLKKSLIITLAFFILLIYLSPRLDVELEEIEPSNVIIDIENIPVTHQIKRTPPPPKPMIPVPSDDETIPEDLTIEETTLKYTTIFDYTPDGFGMSGIRTTPPRPIAWVFPEYPEEEKKKGVQGVVKLSIHINDKGKVIEVVVLDNTTGSQKCAQAAIDAAFGSRFFPAKEGSKPINYWITQPYRFDLRD